MSKRWSKQDISTLREAWPRSSRDELQALFPDRTFDAIRYQAKRQGLAARTAAVNPKRARAQEIVGQIEDGKALSKQEADRLAAMLREQGYELQRSAVPSGRPHRQIPMERWDGNTYKFGLVSCSHLGSIWQQLSALDSFYGYCAENGIDNVLHAGDVTDGDDSMHKGFVYGLHSHGADAQRNYAVEHYPHRPGVHTYAISGNHDLTFMQRAGFNVVRAICDAREDMTFLGDWCADLSLPGGVRVRLRHGRGGTSYAKSYKIQKAIGAMNFRNDPPDVYAIGHWHTPAWLPCVQGVSAFMLAAFQGTTDYVRSLPTVDESSVGGWIVEYQVDGTGGFVPASVKAEFLEFPEVRNDY